MNTLINILIDLFGARPIFANVATGVHASGITKTLEQAVATRYLIGKSGSTSGQVDLCDADDHPLGVITDEGDAGDPVNVALFGAASATQLMVASEPIALGESVYTAASGKVQNQPAVAGVYYHIGTALTAATGNGDVLEVAPLPPRKTILITAFTGTPATDIAALGTALQAAPDKVIVL